MRQSRRPLYALGLLAIISLTGCQSPTDPDDTPDVDDFLVATVTPGTASAEAPTDGRTYRVVRGNNQPDDILAYDWKTTFSIAVLLNEQADDDDYEPLDTVSVRLLTSTTTVS